MDGISWVTIFLAILAIIVPIIVLFVSQRKKKLTCIFYPFLSLVDVRNEVKDNIKIFYNDELVDNLSMRKVNVKNSGNLSIRKEDIVKPLEFIYDDKTKIMAFNESDLNEDGIEIELKHNADKNSIQCFFDLLNKGDEFTLEFVFLGENKKLPDVVSRIDGIKRVDVEDYIISDNKEKTIQFIGSAYMILGILISIFSIFLGIFFDPTAYAFIIVGLFTFVLGFFSKKAPSKMFNIFGIKKK